MYNIENDVKKVLITEEQIKEAVKRIAEEITRDHENSDKQLLLVCILKGSLPFTSDLLKELRIPCILDFMKVSSYGSGTVSTGQVKVKYDLSYETLEDYDVVVIEDIIDTGHTLSNLLVHLKNRQAHSVKLCALVDKPDRRLVDVHVDYKGYTIPDEFIIGYGLDYNEEYRNLPYIGVLKEEVYHR
ncbi:MAG: hypoxanthine phosphoribosyltransferase [Clostridia bacterium]|nr:hypoxanthine phosphoribosyltransferase [Clostridia bacterium]